MFRWSKPVEESRFKAYTTKIFSYVNLNILDYCKEIYNCPKSSRKSFLKLYSMSLLNFLIRYKLIILISSIFLIGIVIYFLCKKTSLTRTKIIISLKKNVSDSDIQNNDSIDNQTNEENDSNPNPTNIDQNNDSNSNKQSEINDPLVLEIPTSSIEQDTTQNIDEKACVIKVDNSEDAENEKSLNIEEKNTVQTEDPEETQQENYPDQDVTITESPIIENYFEHDLTLNNQPEFYPQVTCEQKYQAYNEFTEFKILNQKESSDDSCSNETIIESRTRGPPEFHQESERKNKKSTLISKIPLVHEKNSQSSLKSKCRAPFRNSLIKEWDEIPNSRQSTMKPIKIKNVQVDVKLSDQHSSMKLKKKENKKCFYFDNMDNFSS